MLSPASRARALLLKVPGACNPGFMLSPASRARALLLKVPGACNPGFMLSPASQVKCRSVAHRVDHDVDPDLVSRQTVLHRIRRLVDPFPRIAEIAVAGNERDEAAVL